MEAKNMVCLCECSSRKCGHIYLLGELRWFAENDGTNRGSCPKCGEESYYPLNASGQCRKGSYRGPHDVAAQDIAPSPKMGLKRKRRILAAKARAIEKASR